MRKKVVCQKGWYAKRGVCVRKKVGYGRKGGMRVNIWKKGVTPVNFQKKGGMRVIRHTFNLPSTMCCEIPRSSLASKRHQLPHQAKAVRILCETRGGGRKANHPTQIRKVNTVISGYANCR